MMMKGRLLLPLAAGAIAWLGCDLLAPGQTYAGQLDFAIREGYYVDPPPPPPQIALILQTTTEYPCMNYRLDSELRVAGQLLHVEVSETVRRPNICLTAIGPAQYKVALPVTTGDYTLEFVRSGVTDRYAVSVSDSAIDIVAVQSTFTHSTAQRFPRGN